MTNEQLQEILALQPADTVKELKKSSFTIPKWDDLEKQYDPMKHKIWDTTLYPPKLNENNQDDFKRTALGLQKLAVARIAQAMFATPVTRQYDYDKESEKAQKAVDILEKVYRTQNFIDSENIERGKQLNATCQIATVWKSYEKLSLIEGEQTKFKLAHTTYSAMDGYEIYAQKDENGELLVVSIGYKDTDNVEWLYVYTNEEQPKVLVYQNIKEWELNAELTNTQLVTFPVVYIPAKEPVWKGDEGTNLVEQLEEMESYQGMYIKRNALPTFTLDYGDTTNGANSTTAETSSDSRRIIVVGKGGGMNDVTWNGAEEAISARYARIRNAFFEQVQMPDISFANLINSNTSAENKELLFSDAKAKAEDLGGEWEKLFYQEMEIVKAFVKVMFPSYATELDLISVRSVINPYSVKSKKDNAEYISLAGDAMSLETKVRILNEVDDVMQEVEAIQEKNSADVNQGIL